jgi:biotin transport system permease protein
MAVTLFAYRRGTTPMHRTSALLKLPFLMALCICTFTNGPHEIIRTGICLAVSIVLFLLSGAHLQSLKQLVFVPVLGALVTLFGTLCLPPSAGTATANNGDIITVLPFLALSLTGLKAGILYTVRFFATALAAQVVFETTSSIQIKDALESAQNAIARIFPPLRKLNPALVISLAINFIPQIFETWNRVNLAARARSASRKRKNIHTIITTAYLELQALFSCLLYQAETTRQAVLNRSTTDE